jgi:hypothetical protein
LARPDAIVQPSLTDLRKKEEHLEVEKAAAHRMVPDLLKFAGAGKRNSAEIFVGLKGLRTAYEILLQDAAKCDIALFLSV